MFTEVVLKGLWLLSRGCLVPAQGKLLCVLGTRTATALPCFSSPAALWLIFPFCLYSSETSSVSLFVPIAIYLLYFTFYGCLVCDIYGREIKASKLSIDKSRTWKNMQVEAQPYGFVLIGGSMWTSVWSLLPWWPGGGDPVTAAPLIIRFLCDNKVS